MRQGRLRAARRRATSCDRAGPGVPVPDHGKAESRAHGRRSSARAARPPVPGGLACAPGTSLRLTVIGCSGSFAGPDPRRAASWWRPTTPTPRPGGPADLGGGALGLQRYGVADDLHGSASATSTRPLPGPDRPLRARTSPPRRRAAAYPGLGTEGGSRGGSRPPRPARGPRHVRRVDFREDADAVDLGPCGSTPYPVAHPVPAFGFQVTAGGHTLGSPGTRCVSGCREVARGADLLLAEASPARRGPPTSTSAGTRRRGRVPTACPAGGHARPAVVRRRRHARRGGRGVRR